MGSTKKTFRELKGIRKKIKGQLRELEKKLKEKIDFTNPPNLEEKILNLTKKKTRLRKTFQRKTGRKGPYKT